MLHTSWSLYTFTWISLPLSLTLLNQPMLSCHINFPPHRLTTENTYSQHMKKKLFFPLAISGKPVWARQKVCIILSLHFFPSVHNFYVKIFELPLSTVLPLYRHASSFVSALNALGSCYLSSKKWF